MARPKRGVQKHAKHKHIQKQAKGYQGRSNNTFRAAKQRVEKAHQYAYRDRKQRKRQFRRLWIARINAGARQNGLTYSQFMAGMKNAGIDIDRKVLADMAVREPEAFQAVAQQAQQNLPSGAQG
jgi:large subunit ribosomal protein L20